MIESPCVDVCTIDPHTGLCEGCGRSLDEIASWSGYTDAERRRIMLSLPQRVDAANGRRAGDGGGKR